MWEQGTCVHEWKNHKRFALGDRLVFTLATKYRCNIITPYGQLKDFILLYVGNKKHFEIKNLEIQAYKNYVSTQKVSRKCQKSLWCFQYHVS
jgi:hypothetical protein